MEHGKPVLEEDVEARRVRPRAPGGARWRWPAAGAAAAVALGVAGYFVLRAPRVSTDDAAIEGDVIPVSARVSGHVSRVLVDDNQPVKKGDVLFELDPRDFQNRVDEARANLESAQAQAVKAGADLKRAQALFARDEASQQGVDHARAAALAAKAAVDDKTALLNQAELDLSYTKVVAPEDGRVTRKSVEPGEYVTAGQAALALVPPRVWVVANFKETQLTRMRPGQRAQVAVDAYPSLRLTGRVDSIQAGTGARFSLLPPENATGNFVKVVQRVPVKIVLDDVPGGGRTLAPGMSVEATVDLR